MGGGGSRRCAFGGGGVAAGSGQVWTGPSCSSRAYPTAFIAISVLCVLSRPLAYFLAPRVQTPTSLARVKAMGSRVLGFTVWSQALETKSRSWRIFYVPCLGSFVLRRARLRWPLLATLPTLTGHWGHGGLVVREVKC